MFARAGSCFRRLFSKTIQGPGGVAAVFCQLDSQHHQDIQLANGAELLRHFSETAAEVSSRVVFQFQKRKALPESSGSHTHAVEDLDVAATESTQLMRKR